MRLHESARPPKSTKAELRDEFWAAPNEALLSRKVVAAGLSRSSAWLEALAMKGGGPEFLKCGSHRVLYRKKDVLAWFERYATRVISTSARGAPS